MRQILKQNPVGDGFLSEPQGTWYGHIGGSDPASVPVRTDRTEDPSTKTEKGATAVIASPARWPSSAVYEKCASRVIKLSAIKTVFLLRFCKVSRYDCFSSSDLIFFTFSPCFRVTSNSMN